MGLLDINRNNPTAFGDGLPFLMALEYQERFAEVTDSDTKGYISVPNNQLPAFQIMSDNDIVEMRIVPISGKEDLPSILIDHTDPLVLITNTTTTDERIYHTTDTSPLPFILECGFYYILFTMQTPPPMPVAAPSLYSEVFKVGDVCAYGISLSYVVTQVNMDGSKNVTFTLTFFNDATVVGYVNTIGATPYATAVFSQNNLPLGNTPVSISVETQYCGTYVQNYIFNNGGVPDSLTKQYV